jgi:hypothetical protein
MSTQNLTTEYTAKKKLFDEQCFNYKTRKETGHVAVSAVNGTTGDNSNTARHITRQTLRKNK